MVFFSCKKERRSYKRERENHAAAASFSTCNTYSAAAAAAAVALLSFPTPYYYCHAWCLVPTVSTTTTATTSFFRCSTPPTFLPFSSPFFTSFRRQQYYSSYYDASLGATVARRPSSSRPGQQRRRPYDDEDGEDDDFMEDEFSRRYFYEDDDDLQNDYYDPYATDSNNNDNYYEQQDDNENNYYYEEDEEEAYFLETPPGIEWEEVRVPNNINSRGGPDDVSSTVYVLLPPSPPTMHPLPSAVIHFVGGTWFGSGPKQFYRTLLEDIVTHTQCAVIVTPVPVVTPLNNLNRPSSGSRRSNSKNPLHHVQMAKRIQHQFQYAFEQVLEDEYGSKAMKSIPIAGLGHSLGSRLLVVLATLMQKDNIEMQQQSKQDDDDLQDQISRRRRRDVPPVPTDLYEYKSMILVSFTNLEAAAGIPGITTLLKQRRQLEKRNKSKTKQRRRRPRRTKQRQRYNDDDDDDEFDELMEDLADLWSDITGRVQDNADLVRTRLTPSAEDLEFYPTPRQLWTALEGDKERGNRSRYQIPQTLLVQFDRDDFDQSAKLATVLVSSSESDGSNSTSFPSYSQNITTATTSSTLSPPVITDLKFARLRGTHLTPVTTTASSRSLEEQLLDSNQGLLRELSSKSTKAIWNAIQGRVVGGRIKGGNMSQDEALRDLRQTITRYITDVVTK